MTDASPVDIVEHSELLLVNPQQWFDAQDAALASIGEERIPFRGGLVCQCVYTSYPLLETVMLIKQRIRFNMDAYQFGYRSDVSASAGTHSRGGNTDIGQFQDGDLAVERQCGWTFQHRTTGQGFSMDHGHGFPFGCSHLSPAGQGQQADWVNGRNGLASHGPITGPGPTGRDTPHWQDGVKHMKGIIMSFEDDVASKAAREAADQVVARLGGQLNRIQAQTAGIDRQVLGAFAKDNEVPNEYDPSSPNKGLAVKTVLALILRGNRITNGKLDQIIAAVKGPPA